MAEGRGKTCSNEGSQEIAAMSQTRLLILWLAAYEGREGGGEKNSKLSTRVTALRRINPCVPRACIRVYFFPSIFLGFLRADDAFDPAAMIVALSTPIT